MTERRTNILVVEDEVMISELLADYLSGAGFDVRIAATADEALGYLESEPGVDLLFTDINLAGSSMDGSALAREVRVRRPEMPIVYCSGRVSPSAVAPPVSRSMFLAKPYNLDHVSSLLRRLTA